MLTDNLNAPLILLVEDDENHAELIQDSFLNDQDEFRLEIAGSLRDARKVIERCLPSVVLSDCRLPDGNGKDLIAMSNSAWPVILMTSHGDEKDAFDSLQAGAHEYIVKSPKSFNQMPFIAQRTLREWALIQNPDAPPKEQ